MIGRYVVHYRNGELDAVPIVVGCDVLDWHVTPWVTQTNLVVAWQGTNSGGALVRLFRTTWENARPGELVQSVDLVGERDRAAPFLVALTAE